MPLEKHKIPGEITTLYSSETKHTISALKKIYSRVTMHKTEIYCIKTLC